MSLCLIRGLYRCRRPIQSSLSLDNPIQFNLAGNHPYFFCTKPKHLCKVQPAEEIVPKKSDDTPVKVEDKHTTQPQGILSESNLTSTAPPPVPALPPCPPPSAPSPSLKSVPSNYSSKQIRRNVRSYMFDRYINYLKNYDQVLEKKFPAAMKVYRTFTVGIKDFYRDMKQFLKITRIVNTSSQGLRALTRRELELYYQLPKDMLRVAPVLVLSALPFANYVIFPLAYMYPKQLLSPQFWSEQQHVQFAEENLHDRLRYQMPVLRFMQSRLQTLRDDPENFERMRKVLGCLGSGMHPKMEDITALHDIVTKSEYRFDALPYSHLKSLCGLHGLHTGLRKRQRLAYHAYVVHHMDLAIRREGGVHNMPSDALRKACTQRGLNTTGLSADDQIQWLRNWVELSSPVNGESISMFLYLPILLSYNHPNNWKILYTR